MKLACTLCEYNPLHNGHIKHIEFIRSTLSPDYLVVFMSGNFVQRGESAITDKYKRAVWAIKSGADLVIELPEIFATANAETFASGAIKMISHFNMPSTFVFGAENDNIESFYINANILLDESKEFKTMIKDKLATGISLAKARYETAKSLNIDGFDSELFENPNNILGIEYTKAVLKYNADIELVPMKRDAGHNDNSLYKNVTSASSIRNNLGKVKKSKFKSVMPKYVYEQLPDAMPDSQKGIMTAILTTPAEKMKLVPDCTEGLENRIKSLAEVNTDYETALKKIVTKRYTESRIRRICIANLLGITNDLTEEAFESNLYFKVLASNQKGLEFIGTAKNKTDTPFLTRKTDYSKLDKTAREVFNIDALSCKLYSVFTDCKVNEYATEIVK